MPRASDEQRALFLDGRVELHCGDCLEVLATLDSLDACVTDPPYGLSFMGKNWDHGVPGIPFWKQVFRVLKPGGHLIAFGGSRTYHRLACAIEDAGFEIRDQLQWIYGSGFPKSLNVSKAIDKAAGELGARGKGFNAAGIGRSNGGDVFRSDHPEYQVYVPSTTAAKQWDGWGTGLKPGAEPICMARKPLSERTIAANVLRWGTGAINVDGCRVDAPDAPETATISKLAQSRYVGVLNGGRTSPPEPRINSSSATVGRWPANVVHDGSDEVVGMFPDVGRSPPIGAMGGGSNKHSIYGDFAGERHENGYGDSGSAARFFYSAKADADDRLGSRHPTIKPVDLMQWLVRLVTPPKGVCIDPFAGTGVTGEAAWREGMRAVLIELEAEYQADIRRRMALCLSGPDERKRESVKAKNLPRDDGPLFA